MWGDVERACGGERPYRQSLWVCVAVAQEHISDRRWTKFRSRWWSIRSIAVWCCGSCEDTLLQVSSIRGICVCMGGMQNVAAKGAHQNIEQPGVFRLPMRGGSSHSCSSKASHFARRSFGWKRGLAAACSAPPAQRAVLNSHRGSCTLRIVYRVRSGMRSGKERPRMLWM